MTSQLIMNSLEAQLSKLICVSKPYYALQQLQQLEDGKLQAEINVQNLTHGETTLISGSEAGRHLAILGSCALALENPVKTRHYYLANQAFISRGKHDEAILSAKPLHSINLILQAKVVFLDLTKKCAKVDCSIRTQEGELIFHLEVAYQVLKEDLFQKLFRKGFIADYEPVSINPYTKTVDIEVTGFADGVLSGKLGVISAEQCVGHFDHYPALPIAILSGGLSKLAAMHLKIMFKNNDLKYALKRSTLSASRLAFAGEEVFVHSTFIAGTNNGEYTYYAKALNAKGDDLGEIEITFDLMKELMYHADHSTHYFPLRKKHS